MGRTRRDCPVFGCTSKNLARLANHLDQMHNMDTQERAKWLKWSKLGLRLPLQTEESSVGDSSALMQETLEKILRQQEEMERNFHIYLTEEQGTSTYAKHKKKSSKQSRNKKQDVDKNMKWLSF